MSIYTIFQAVQNDVPGNRGVGQHMHGVPCAGCCRKRRYLPISGVKTAGGVPPASVSFAPKWTRWTPSCLMLKLKIGGMLKLSRGGFYFVFKAILRFSKELPEERKRQKRRAEQCEAKRSGEARLLHFYFFSRAFRNCLAPFFLSSGFSYRFSSPLHAAQIEHTPPTQIEDAHFTN